MKKQLFIIVALLMVNWELFAQQKIEDVLQAVEQNNTTLAALRKNADAEKLNNRSGIFLENPEVEYHYLWVEPDAVGNRTDVSISQSFDFPTVYKFRNNISNIKNEQVELQFEKQKKEVLLETRLTCNELIYTNAMHAELDKRKLLADSIFVAYKQKFDAGETNILEYNKSRLNKLSAEKELKAVEIEQKALLIKLQGLNGGKPLDFCLKQFPILNIPSDFEEWYLVAEQKNPMLSWLKKEVQIRENKIKLSKAEQLPKINTGYMSEKRDAAHFQGFIIGVTIPLWENINTVKHAKAEAEALQSVTRDNKLQFYNLLKATHQKFIQLQENVVEYKSGMEDVNNASFLEKALNHGEIGLIDYILELSVYNESIDKILEMEKDLNDAFAELNQYM
ncbi:TolC family protein [Maribellus maritimus]|uniref:TolC family protein n=1 Tax=Maribellus maritimus TaxID=2870838 RepID=UPI001EEBE82A|nr:TolC family protein [Maribellus maritimus]MCG6189441.1 TolC family protein [Maribellus maritimus]